MEPQSPTVTRAYYNHHLDSSRWRVYEPRSDDIIVTTSIKSGTTWMQAIVRELLVEQSQYESWKHIPLPDSRSSYWPDARFAGTIDSLARNLSCQQHRRCLKTHLPFDGLPYYSDVSYIVVARDPRDVFMSLWNYYSNFTPEALALVNRGLPTDSPPCPPCPDNIHVFWNSWITHGWFEWEREGFPFWGNMHHTATWWKYRHLPNIEFFHYARLIAEPEREIGRLAEFLGIQLDASGLERVIKTTTLQAMRERYLGIRIWPPLARGALTFFHKGENGRWRDVLTDDELARYFEVQRDVLQPECAAWIAQGL
jgi:aryl sulfotransferase